MSMMFVFWTVVFVLFLLLLIIRMTWAESAGALSLRPGVSFACAGVF